MEIKEVQRVYGLHPTSVESQIIGVIESVSYRRGLHITAEQAPAIRGFAETIIEHILGGGGAGRVEPSGRIYSSKERDRNLKESCGFAKRVAERLVIRAREGNAVFVDEMYIGDQRIRFRSNGDLVAGLCPPPLPPIC